MLGVLIPLSEVAAGTANEGGTVVVASVTCVHGGPLGRFNHDMLPAVRPKKGLCLKACSSAE